MSAPSASGSIVPAQLGFLTIFNPTLGNTDETIEDQIVYYASVTTQAAQNKRQRARGQPTQNISPEERNERLRQIGLAQGMASFSRGFASGSTVDTIDTEKSRVILHELEPGWWILASIDLTKLPLPPRLATKKAEVAEERYEYSSREMKPASLLLRDLLRAHSIFLMHHDSSLSALFVRNRRTKFITILSRYWDLYLSTWNVMMHGNPARDIFGGIPIASSGELGVGVGEEDRGSGERAVLEGLVGRIEGLVDLVVSKFGDYNLESPPPNDSNGDPEQWLGTGREPGPDDGAIFLGTGALSRKSLRDVTHWMEDLYTWGDHAYGIIESPTSVRRAKRKRAADRAAQQAAQDQTQASADEPAKEPEAQAAAGDSGKDQSQEQAPEDGRLDKMVSYLKLGYGTYWSLPGGVTASGDPSPNQPQDTRQDSKPVQNTPKVTRPNLAGRTPSYEAAGHYLIGLKGEIDQDYSGSDSASSDDAADGEHNSRTVLRTVNVELESEALDRPEAITVRDFEHPASALTQSQVVGNMIPGYDSHDLNKAKKLRVVVYVNRPFVFTFLFNLRTDSLAMESLYRSLHHQLAPLRKPLLLSTRYRPERPGLDNGSSSSSNSSNTIYDLVWDPVSLTVHSSLPNIPDAYDNSDPWTRADALNTHLHLVNLYISTRSRSTALERTEKSSRGWWIVWTRLLDRQEDATSNNLSTIQEGGADADTEHDAALEEEERKYSGPDSRHPDVAKEIFLIRRASDHVGFRTENADGAGKLAQGIGVDTRRYVEELLNLL